MLYCSLVDTAEEWEWIKVGWIITANRSGSIIWNYSEALTEKVFISVRKGQQVDYHNLIEDLYDDLGPFGAIMTAMQTYPEAAFLVFLLTDIPFLGKEHLKFLVKERDLHYRATAYQGLGKDYPGNLWLVFGNPK